MSSWKMLAPVYGAHQAQVLEKAYAKLENFHPLTEAVATGISKGQVAHTDAGGKRSPCGEMQPNCFRRGIKDLTSI